MSLPPADWYADPSDPAALRYWDGATWTSHTHPKTQPAAPVAQQPQPIQQASFQPAQQNAQGLDPIGGRIVAPGFGHSMTPGMGSPAGPYSAPMTFAPERSRRGLWVGLGIAGSLIVLVVVLVVIVILPKFAPLSTNYSGAPVTSSDIASAGNAMVISPSEAVAVEIPTHWRDVNSYMDLESDFAELPAGATVVGAWFTKAPTSAGTPPQLIIAMEVAPSASGLGTMDDIRRQYLGDLEHSDPGLEISSTEHYETDLGLEGDRTELTFDNAGNGVSGTMSLVAVAHGRRFVLVMWVSYDGPIDEESFDAFMTSLRVDS